MHISIEHRLWKTDMLSTFFILAAPKEETVVAEECPEVPIEEKDNGQIDQEPNAEDQEDIDENDDVDDDEDENGYEIPSTNFVESDDVCRDYYEEKRDVEEEEVEEEEVVPKVESLLTIGFGNKVRKKKKKMETGLLKEILDINKMSKRQSYH